MSITATQTAPGTTVGSPAGQPNETTPQTPQTPQDQSKQPKNPPDTRNPGSPATPKRSMIASGEAGDQGTEPGSPDSSGTKSSTPKSSSDDWRAGYSEDLRADKTLAQFNSLEDALRGHISLAKKLGGDKIPLPGKDAKPEDWNAFYNSIGRPEKPDGYKMPENLPDGVALDDSIISKFREHAHKQGLTANQFASAVRFQAEMVAAAQAEMVAAGDKLRGEALTKMKSELGSAFGDRMRAVGAFAKSHGGEEFLSFLDASLADGSKLGDNPAMIRFLSTVVGRMADDPIIGRGSNGMSMTPKEARETRAAYSSDFRAALLDRNHQDHAKAVKRNADLLDIEAQGLEAN